jgi:hypothetical protein
MNSTAVLTRMLIICTAQQIAAGLAAHFQIDHRFGITRKFHAFPKIDKSQPFISQKGQIVRNF